MYHRDKAPQGYFIVSAALMVRAGVVRVVDHLNRLISILIAKEVITILPTYNRAIESPLMVLQSMSIRDLII